MGNNGSQDLTGSQKAPVVVYSKTTCPYCVKAKNLLNDEKIDYVALELNKLDNGHQVVTDLRERTGLNYVPQIFVCGEFIGGFTELQKLQQNGVLQQMAEKCSKPQGAKSR